MAENPSQLHQKLQAEVFTALFEPDLGWKHILQKLADLTGANGGALIPVKAAERGPHMTHTDSIKDLAEAYVKSGWNQRDTRQKGLKLWQRRKVFVDQDYMTAKEADHDPMVQDLLVPLGYKYAAVMHVSYGDASYAFSLQREFKRGPFQAEEQNFLEEFSHNISLAARLSGEFSMRQHRSASHVFDELNVAALALGYDKKLRFSNSLFDQLLGPVFKTFNSQVHLLNEREDSAFQALIDRSLSYGLIHNSVPELLVQAGPLQNRLMIRAMSFPRTGMNLFSNVGLLLFCWELKSSIANRLQQRTRHHFKFTPAEARLSELLHQGFAPQECAELLAISVETVRSQIKSMFNKTDTNRHSELMQLLIRISLFK